MQFLHRPHLTALSSSWPVQTAIDHWRLSVAAIVFSFLFFRYLRNAYIWYRLQYRPQDSPEPREPPLIPPTIPYLGHVISNAISYQGYTASLSRRYNKCSVLTLPMITAKHHLIIAPSLVHQVFTSRDVTNKFSGEPFFFGLMETVFGDDDKLFRNMDQDILWGPVSKTVQGMMRESFLNPALSLLNEGVSERICKLVSFKSNRAEQETWEQAAKVTVIDSGSQLLPASTPAASAAPATVTAKVPAPVPAPVPAATTAPAALVSLHPLLRDFVGHLAISILLGPDFLINYPNTLPDLFTLDASLSLLLSGLPSNLPALQPAADARNRLLSSLRAHHIAYHKSINGQDPGPSWQRISQTSNVIAERISAFATAGDFDPSKPSSSHGTLSALGNLVVLWALNVNANQITFWMIYHIYSHPNLLAEIRSEIAPYLKSTTTKKDSPHLTINLPSLQTSCPLLKGSFLETLRHESGATIYRYIHTDFLMTESDQDAKTFGHGCPQTYIFRKGEYICVPNGVHQSDERYFPGAKGFDARRFWVSEDEEKEGKEEGGGIKVDYKTMHPWGGGPTVCKGKKFAEGEVLTFVAAIVNGWDMVRVDDKGREIPWGPHPGHKGGTGAVVPKRDVRVKIWRRQGNK